VIPGCLTCVRELTVASPLPRRFGFNRPRKILHKPTEAEASKLQRVDTVTVPTVRSPVKLTKDGTRVFTQSMECLGTSYVADMDVRRAFKAEKRDERPPSPKPVANTGGVKSPTDVEKAEKLRTRQPLGMPRRPHSYYT